MCFNIFFKVPRLQINSKSFLLNFKSIKFSKTSPLINIKRQLKQGKLLSCSANIFPNCIKKIKILHILTPLRLKLQTLFINYFILFNISFFFILLPDRINSFLFKNLPSQFILIAVKLIIIWVVIQIKTANRILLSYKLIGPYLIFI